MQLPAERKTFGMAAFCIWEEEYGKIGGTEIKTVIFAENFE